MDTSICYFIVALVCGAVCNPLGHGTICETQNRLNGLTQALGSVCDATSNLLGRGYGHGLHMEGAPYLPSYVNGPFYPYGISPGYGSTTVYENVPNVCPGLGGLGGCSGLSAILPSSTTVTGCTPNLGLEIGGNAYVGPAMLDEIVPCSTTACTCESTPYYGPGLCYGLPYYPNRACQTNMCESMNPNLGLGTGCIGYGGACGLDANVPVSNTVCTCERSPNLWPGIGYGLSYFPNSAGPTTICEAVTPKLNPEMECNGYGGACGLGANVPVSNTVCTCERSPNLWPGIGYGLSYFPNSAGPTTICEAVTPNLNPEMECNGYEGACGVGVCESTPMFGPGLHYGAPYFHSDSATVCPCESTPNFGPGVCCGGPFFPNRCGQIPICESVPNVSPGYLHGIPTCNSFGPGLGYGYH